MKSDDAWYKFPGGLGRLLIMSWDKSCNLYPCTPTPFYPVVSTWQANRTQYLASRTMSGD